MEEAIEPLEFRDDVEVSLPEVVCDWELDQPSAQPLPTVTRAPSPPKTDDTNTSPTSRRRKYSAVASFFLGPKPAETSSPESSDAEADANETPPILAALEAVSFCPDRGDRDLDAFHFGVLKPVAPTHLAPLPTTPDQPHEEVTRPRARSTASSLDLRNPSITASAPLSPASSSSGEKKPASPLRHRRSTRTSIQRDVEALMTLGHTKSSSPEKPSGNFNEQVEKRWQASDIVKTNATVAVGVLPDSTSVTSRDPLAGRFSPGRSVALPPIAARSCDPEHSPRRQSPRKSRCSQLGLHTGVCVACGIALDGGDGAATVTLDAVRSVHRACFCCTECREPLALGSFYVVQSNPENPEVRTALESFSCSIHDVARLHVRDTTLT